MKNEKNIGRLRNWLLLPGDVLSLAFSVLGALYFYRLFGGNYHMTVFFAFTPFIATFPVLAVFARLYGVNFIYGGVGLSAQEELKRITLLIFAAFAFEFTFLALRHDVERISRVASVLSVFFSCLLVPAVRHLLRFFLHRFRMLETPLLVAGCGKTAQNMVEILRGDSFHGLNPVGFVADDENAVCAGLPRLGALDDAEKVMETSGVSTLLVALPPAEVARKRGEWRENVPQILFVGDDESFPVSWSYLVDLNGFFTVGVMNQLKWRFFRFLKYVIEVVFCAVAIIFALVPGLLIALLVKLTSRGPVFYYARRLGKNGKPFACIKFRTMYRNADKKLARLLENDPDLKAEWENNFKLARDPRVTPVGRFLRRTSLDELPQLINVLKGDMSLIGPRPIVEEEKVFFGDKYDVISKVKPGVTGLWQVSGRNNLSYERRVFLNMYYLNNWSIWLDYYIFLATIREIIFPVGAK